MSIIQKMETKYYDYENNLKVMELRYEDKEKEFAGLESKLDKMEKEKAEMKEELSSQIEFLQSQFEESDHCKDELKMEIESLKNQKKTFQSENVEFQTKFDDLTNQLYDQTVARNSLEENLKESKINMVELMDSITSLKQGKSKLEEELMITKKSKDDIAAALSQFITNTNEVKESASKLDRENQRLKEEVDAVQTELKLVREVKEALELKDLEKSSYLKDYENLAAVKVAHEAEIENLKRTLASEEIKFTDYEQTSAQKEENKIKEALAAQKERYNENHKKILKDQTKKFQDKMTEMFNDNDIRVKKLEEEKLALSTKNENYKEKVRDLEKKFQDNQILDQKEIELYKSKYEKTKELLNNKSTEQATEVENLRAEKRSLESQLKFADAKLRESNKHADSGAVMPPSQTRSRESIGGNSSIVRSRPSVPGRARQQVVSANLENLDDTVFKIPGPNTPGRARAGRTVSDSRMNTSFRPPAGSGSLFNCDEEDGEVFSNSYLADVKDGRCELDSSGARMSELARRNSMYPQHLKSAYAVELGSNISVSEDEIRQSRFSLATNASQLPSPSSKLSQLSLDSPSQSTRSKKSNVRPPTSFTLDNENFRKKPGSAVRSSSSNSVTSTTSTKSGPRTSSTGSLNRLRPPRPSKQICTGGHGQKKQVCKTEHGEPRLQETAAALPENVKQSRKRKTPAKKEKEEATPSKTFRTEEDTEDMDNSQDSNNSFVRASLRGSKRVKAGNVSYNKPGPPTPDPRPGRESLGNLSLPKSNSSMVSLDTTQSCPGASGHTPDMSRVSARSALSQKTPLLDATNIMQTPVANKTKNQSKLGTKMTPLRFKKMIGSAFRGKKQKKYSMMEVQDKTINRDQNVKDTPLK